MKVMLGRSLSSVNSVAPLDHVQVDFKYASLRHGPFKHDCQRRFLTLSQKRSLRREIEILRELLADS